jgi:hypothetical protein
MSCVLACLVPSLPIPATVMHALPDLHRNAQYHALSCFSSPARLSYSTLPCPVLHAHGPVLPVHHKLTLTPTFYAHSFLPTCTVYSPYQVICTLIATVPFCFLPFIAALPCPPSGSVGSTCFWGSRIRSRIH